MTHERFTHFIYLKPLESVTSGVGIVTKAWKSTGRRNKAIVFHFRRDARINLEPKKGTPKNLDK